MATQQDYEKFINQLRQPQGELLKEKLQKNGRFPLQQQRKLVHQFLKSIQKDSENHLAFIDPETQLYDAEHVNEGWEKLVMTKVFDFVFGAPNTEEPRSNQILKNKVETYQWIEERHLDLSINFSLSLEVVQAELLRINGFRSPRDKLVILENVIRLIVDLIKKRTGAVSPNNDSLLPSLILVIIRSNPPNLISNVKYITRFRNPEEMEKGSNQYVMTTMMSAISFIYNISAKSLTLNSEEKAKWPGELIGEGTKDELKEFTSQVSGFFGNLIKEVKSTADEIINGVSSPNQQSPTSPSKLFGNDSIRESVPSPGTSQSPVLNESFQQLSVEERESLRAEREQYEIDLAIAMSLSEAQTKNEKSLLDIDSYTPMTTVPPRHSIDEQEDDVALKRST